MPMLGGQLWHGRRIELRPTPRELDHAAIIGSMNEGLNAGTGSIRSGVHVCHQTDHRWLGAVARSRQRGEHVTVLVELGVAQPGLVKLGHEEAPQLELPRAAWASVL